MPTAPGEVVKCDNCGADIPWDKVHRYKDNDRKITKLCLNCCYRCGDEQETTKTNT